MCAISSTARFVVSVGATTESLNSSLMPCPAGVSTAPWRRWASKLHLIVTDDGATIDFALLDLDERLKVADRDLMCLLTAAVQSVKIRECRNLTDASITAVAESCSSLTRLDISGCRRLAVLPVAHRVAIAEPL